MSAAFSISSSRPVLSPITFKLPNPVSNSTSRLPVFTTSVFCCSSSFSGERKLSASARLNSSGETPPNTSAFGWPRSRGPSEIAVASKAPILKR